MFRICALLTLGFLLASGPAHAHTLFALVDTGELYVSSNRGVTWTPRSMLPLSDAVGLIAGETSSRLFIASESGVVYRSQNSGSTWTVMGSVTSDDVVDLQARSDGALLVLTAAGTIWISIDEGATFAALAALTASNYVSLAVGRTGNLYALTETGEVEESTDDGLNWVVMSTIAVSDAVEIRSLGSDLYVLTETGLVSRSADGGASWVTVGTLSQVHMRGLTQDIDRLAAITEEGEVANSSNGTTWTWVGTVNQLSVKAMANDTPYAIGIREEPPPVALPIALAPPAPNPLPSGGTVQLRFELPEADEVAFALLNLQGRQVQARAAQRFDTSGEHEISWRLDNMASGTYVVRVSTAKGFRRSAKITVLR